MDPERIGRLQPITWEKASIPILEQVESFCQGGAEWVQLRLKELSDERFLSIAREAREITRNHGTALILNDRAEMVKKVEADGVHLGEKDLTPQEARKLLSEDHIIGGTADRFERIESLWGEVDYIGCGPYRETRTKKKHSPVLGLEGYRRILRSMKEKGIDVPILAIGGIQKSDVASLIQEGLHGIALSSAITEAKDPVAETASFLRAIEEARS